MTKIKICGLSRPCDIDAVNAAKPDYCGFIVNFPKSRRNVSPDQLRQLRARLSRSILPVGVFVNEPTETIVSLVRDGAISLVQLHGQEDEAYLATLRSQVDVPIIKAYKVTGPADAELAQKSTADHILLDSGAGTGKTFDWAHLKNVTRPYFLAGGLGPDNLAFAIKTLRPYAVDLSSGVETGGLKDREKILAAVQAVREANL